MKALDNTHGQPVLTASERNSPPALAGLVLFSNVSGCCQPPIAVKRLLRANAGTGNSLIAMIRIEANTRVRPPLSCIGRGEPSAFSNFAGLKKRWRTETDGAVAPLRGVID